MQGLDSLFQGNNVQTSDNLQILSEQVEMDSVNEEQSVLFLNILGQLSDPVKLNQMDIDKTLATIEKMNLPDEQKTQLKSILAHLEPGNIQPRIFQKHIMHGSEANSAQAQPTLEELASFGDNILELLKKDIYVNHADNLDNLNSKIILPDNFNSPQNNLKAIIGSLKSNEKSIEPFIQDENNYLKEISEQHEVFFQSIRTENVGNNVDLAKHHKAIALDTAFGSKQWIGDLANKLVYANNQRLQTVDIHMNPPELGPLEVLIEINQDKASITFNSNVGAVRDSIESSAQRLKSMMEDQGMNSVNIDVSNNDRQEAGRQFSQSGDYDDKSSLFQNGTEQQTMTVQEFLSHDGIVNYYI